MYGSLSTITHGDILTGHTQSLIFCAIKQKAKKQNKKKALCLSVPLWTQLSQYVCIRCDLCYISSFFFNDINMSMVVRRKKRLYEGKSICLLKKQNCSQARVSWVIFWTWLHEPKEAHTIIHSVNTNKDPTWNKITRDVFACAGPTCSTTTHH